MSAIARDPQASESDLQVETVADASLERENVDVTVEGRSTWSKRRTDECDDVACCICVPNSLLQSWWLERTHDTSYIQLVNDNVRGKIITLDSNCERLERRLYRKAGEVARRAAKTKPNQAKLQYLAKSTSFDILFGETLQASHLQEELEMVNQDIGKWIEQYEGSMETIALLREQLASATSPTSSTASSTSATSSTTTLVTASTTSGILRELTNTGRPLNQVGERQRRRKVSELKNSVQYVLSFVDSFGLTVENIAMSNSATGTPLTLTYQPSSSSSGSSLPSSTNSSSSPRNQLCSNDTLYQTLYLLDRFGVSDEFYHELAMAHPSLPRSVETIILLLDTVCNFSDCTK